MKSLTPSPYHIVHVSNVLSDKWQNICPRGSRIGTNTFFVSLIGKFRCPNFATSRANFAKISLVFFYFSLVRTGKSAKNFFAVGVDLALYIYSKLRSGRTGTSRCSSSCSATCRCRRWQIKKKRIHRIHVYSSPRARPHTRLAGLTTPRLA